MTGVFTSRDVKGTWVSGVPAGRNPNSRRIRLKSLIGAACLPFDRGGMWTAHIVRPQAPDGKSIGRVARSLRE